MFSLIDEKFNKISKKMKKIYYFLMICGTVAGIIGGIGYTLFCKAYPLAVGLVMAGWMAWPKVKEYANKLMM